MNRGYSTLRAKMFIIVTFSRTSNKPGISRRKWNRRLCLCPPWSSLRNCSWGRWNRLGCGGRRVRNVAFCLDYFYVGISLNNLFFFIGNGILIFYFVSCWKASLSLRSSRSSWLSVILFYSPRGTDQIILKSRGFVSIGSWHVIAIVTCCDVIINRKWFYIETKLRDSLIICFYPNVYTRMIAFKWGFLFKMSNRRCTKFSNTSSYERFHPYSRNSCVFFPWPKEW